MPTVLSSNDNSVYIDIEDQNKILTEKLANEISQQSSPSSNSYIYKVPKKLVISEDRYVPRVISIGPYHHGKEHLKASERYKSWYLQSFLSRFPDIQLLDVVNSVRKMEISIRECYAEPIDCSSDDFVKMMTFDSGFILELLYKYQEEKVDSKDCLFTTTWTIPSLRRDMVLLENQVPFILLEMLFNLCNRGIRPIFSLSKLILDFFDPILPTVLETSKDNNFKGKHLLDLLRNCLLHPYQAMEDNPIFCPSEVLYFGESPMSEYTSCAVNLQAAGVKFKRKDDSRGLLDITFGKDLIFEFTPFCVEESWNVLFTNMIVLEQCRCNYPNKITSYGILLNKLINSPADVKLLRENGIVEGVGMNDENVVRAIYKMCEGVVLDQFYYDGLCGRVNKYCQPAWFCKVKATLTSYYFKYRLIVPTTSGATMLVLAFIQAFN